MKGSVKLRLKKGDQVKVISGKDKGKTGRILKTEKEKRRVLVEGINIVKKTVRPKKEGDKGEIMDIEAAFSIAKVMILCKKCGPTRVGYKMGKDGVKVRICKKCGEVL